MTEGRTKRQLYVLPSGSIKKLGSSLVTDLDFGVWEGKNSNNSNIWI